MEDNRERNQNHKPHGNDGANRERKNNNEHRNADNPYHKKKRHYNNKYKNKQRGRDDAGINKKELDEAMEDISAEELIKKEAEASESVAFDEMLAYFQGK